MIEHDKAVIHGSAVCDWGTPRALFNALMCEFGFLLDVAANASNAKCELYFGPDQENELLRDGLAANWTSFFIPLYQRPAFMNPPYSREQSMPIDLWIEKAWRESAQGVTVVGVIPASIQTIWWSKYIRGVDPKTGSWLGHAADEVREIPHRVNFDASPTALDMINRKRAAKGKPPVEEAWNAGGNTAVVIWRPNPGYVGPWEPKRRTWTYRTQEDA